MVEVRQGDGGEDERLCAGLSCSVPLFPPPSSLSRLFLRASAFNSVADVRIGFGASVRARCVRAWERKRERVPFRGERPLGRVLEARPSCPLVRPGGESAGVWGGGGRFCVQNVSPPPAPCWYPNEGRVSSWPQTCKSERREASSARLKKRGGGRGAGPIHRAQFFVLHFTPRPALPRSHTNSRPQARTLGPQHPSPTAAAHAGACCVSG